MHYFLGMEVWQEDGRVFLGQGKYAHDILQRFQMLVCRPMATPMTTNFWKLLTSKSELVDATLYCQLIGSLMYLVNTRPGLSFAVNTLSQFGGGATESALDCHKTCAEVHSRYNSLWTAIYKGRWSQTCWVFRF